MNIRENSLIHFWYLLVKVCWVFFFLLKDVPPIMEGKWGCEKPASAGGVISTHRCWGVSMTMRTWGGEEETQMSALPSIQKSSVWFFKSRASLKQKSRLWHAVSRGGAKLRTYAKRLAALEPLRLQCHLTVCSEDIPPLSRARLTARPAAEPVICTPYLKWNSEMVHWVKVRMFIEFIIQTGHFLKRVLLIIMPGQQAWVEHAPERLGHMAIPVFFYLAICNYCTLEACVASLSLHLQGYTAWKCILGQNKLVEENVLTNV